MDRENMTSREPKNAVHQDIVEPVTTLRDEGKFIHIMTKLPGIAEEKIRLDIDLEKTRITIVAADTSKIFKKVITLHGDVVFSKKHFSEGELYLVMERKESCCSLGEAVD